MNRDSLAEEFEVLDQDATQMLVRTGWAACFESPGSAGAENGAVAAAMRAALDPAHPEPPSSQTVPGGRTPHRLVTAASGERVLVRAYRRGGFLRHLNQSRYWAGRRARDELRATEYARVAGVRTPLVLAAAERRWRIGYTAALASRWIPDAADLADWLPGADAPARDALLRELGCQLATLHAAGIEHRDLNLRNVLVAPDSGPLVGGPLVYLLDFDRARVHEQALSATLRGRGLRRFQRSAKKLGVALRAEDWDALRAGYGAAWPLPVPGRASA